MQNTTNIDTNVDTNVDANAPVQQYGIISGINPHYDHIHITRGYNYKANFELIYGLALAYSNSRYEIQFGEYYAKPMTQLLHINARMDIILEEYLEDYRAALQFVDYAAYYIIEYTYGDKADTIVNPKYLNCYELSYAVNVFGANTYDLLKLASYIGSEGAIRHCAKKAHKMIFLYYYMLSNDYTPNYDKYDIKSYIVGAIRHASFVFDSLVRRHKPYPMAYIAYLWTLDTFFNGLHAINHECYDIQGKTVVPSHHSFPYLHQLRCVDILSHVNTYVIENDLLPEVLLNSDNDNNSIMHLHNYSRCFAQIPLTTNQQFYSVTHISDDYMATKAFIETIDLIHELMDNDATNIMNIFDALYTLDAFEESYISTVPVRLSYENKVTFESMDAAYDYCHSITLPIGVKRNDLLFICWVKDPTRVYDAILLSTKSTTKHTNTNRKH